MNLALHLPDFLKGFGVGFIVMIIIQIVYWRRGKKLRRFDERYEKIQLESRSISWGFTLIALIVAIMLLAIIDGWSNGFIALISVYAITIISYFIATIVKKRRY